MAKSKGKGSGTQKTTWEDVKRGAAMPPSDNSDEHPSGIAAENYTPPHGPDNYPINDSGSNKPHPKIGDEGKMLLYKAQETLKKSLDDPEVLKAMDTLEKAGVFRDAGTLLKADGEAEKAEGYTDEKDDDDDDSEEESSMKGQPAVRKSAYVPTPGDVASIVDGRIARHLEPITKALQGLQDGITKMVSGNAGGANAALQKVGFIPAGETGKPEVSPAEQVPGYSKAAPRLQKSGEGEAQDSLPDFNDLPRLLREGVL